MMIWIPWCIKLPQFAQNKMRFNSDKKEAFTMNQEVNKDMAAMSYANLTDEQLKQLMSIEDDINKNRQEKVFLMAFVNKH